ncbi:MAG: DUF3179 domain-containing protein [Balneolaceae bacterium]|nr:DUF3179 domain-containing protein [Balneolaceae bacterium]
MYLSDTILRILLILLLYGFLFTACSNSVSDSSNDGHDNWIIPRDQVVSGGPGKDGIPSVDRPVFAKASEVQYIDDDRRVVGLRIGDTIRAYPHQILDWHEIVNDEVNGTPVAITHCPLTGTAIGWNRKVNGQVTEFGVSGLLFRNNLIPYDRHTDSNWSQMQMRSVAGELAGTDIKTEDLLETTWATWKSMYPDSEVLTRETGYNRGYTGYAYGSTYSTDDSAILFPITHHDDRLDRKDRVHGVILERPADEVAPVRVYPIKVFGEGVNVIQETLRGQRILVVGSREHDFAASFRSTLPDGTQLEMKAVQDALPVVMEDGEGNRWNLFGVAVEGPRKGQRLQPTHSYTGYWFAWVDFFPALDLYQAD